MKILDLYCGAGGASAGYARAGLAVVGVDINPQPDYPYEFHRVDALEYLLDFDRADFAAIHASPPCQSSSALTKGTNFGRVYPQLIPRTRELLIATGLPYVIENVAGAPIRKDLMLCGEMFGLAVLRHRYFELGRWTMVQPEHKRHRGRVAGMRHGKWYDGPYWAVYGDGGGKGSVADWQQAMDMNWTADRKSIAEAIPSAYTNAIGSALISNLVRPDCESPVNR